MPGLSAPSDRHVDLSGQRAAVLRAARRGRKAGDRARKDAVRYFRNMHLGLDAGFDADGFVLRHVELDTDHVCCASSCTSSGDTGLHQTAIVDVALGDDTVKGRDDALMGPLLLTEHLDLRFLRRDVGSSNAERSLLRRKRQPVVVALLLREPALARPDCCRAHW